MITSYVVATIPMPGDDEAPRVIAAFERAEQSARFPEEMTRLQGRCRFRLFFLLRQLVLLKNGWFESYICRQFLSTIQNGTCGGLTEKYGPYGVTDEEIEIWALCKTVSTFKTKMPCHSTYQSTSLHNFSL